MKKFILMLVVMFTTMLSVNAQVATENAKFFDNTYVGVEIGATTPFNFNSWFPVNPVVGIKVGKELTPVFGLEVEGTAVFGDNIYRRGFSASIPAVGSFNMHKNGSTNTFFKATTVGLNGVINLSNLVLGYKGTPRTFEMKTNTGFSWLHYFGDYTPTYPIGGYILLGKSNVLVAKTAIDLAFNLGTQKQHSIVVSPGIYWGLNEEGNIKFNKNYAQFGITVGYIYHFKTSNGTHHFKTYDVGAMTDEIGRLNDELAKKSKEVIVEKIVNAPTTNATDEHATGFGVNETVYFALNSDELDARAKETLDKLGQNGVYAVDAYASSEGSTEYNLALSQRRADAVKAYLEGRGARVDSAVGHGVQFGTTTGRVAIVRLK